MHTPNELQRLIPLSDSEKAFVLESRKTVQKILGGEDERQLLIVGPCSLQDRQADLDYAERLKELSKSVEDTFFVLMRAYFEKPRSSIGWKGLLMDPAVDGSNNIADGLIKTRELLAALTKLKIPLATEFLSPITPIYFEEMISWGCIGARTTSSQVHREMASGLQMPVGFKNTTDGNVLIAIASLLSAKSPHTYFSFDEMGQAVIQSSLGNPHSHLILRGGHHGINYDTNSVASAALALSKKGLPQRLLIDCSHGNACQGQMAAFESAVSQIAEGNRTIKGMLIESHINAGQQSAKHPLKFGVSITDNCLDFSTTREMVLSAKHQLKSSLMCV